MFKTHGCIFLKIRKVGGGGKLKYANFSYFFFIMFEGVQNALFKIAMKQYVRLLMILDFDFDA